MFAFRHPEPEPERKQPLPSIGHRLRCVTVKIGIVNTCPGCGLNFVTDWTFDFSRDPGEGPIVVDSEESAREFVGTLRDLGPSLALPCIGCDS